jgi:hypothetical protein
VLVSRGILRDGSKVLLHMGLGNKESHDGWPEHFRPLVSRGLPTPLAVTSDGACGRDGTDADELEDGPADDQVRKHVIAIIVIEADRVMRPSASPGAAGGRQVPGVEPEMSPG